MDSIRIEISGNAEALQPTVDKLKEIGAIDKKNADQFKASNAEYMQAAIKRDKILEEEKQDLIELQKLRKLAYSPEEIQQYNNSIQQSQQRIRLLSQETVGAGKSMEGVVKQTNALGESVKKSYGFLRIAANIIPGLGISGLLLVGYELLAGLVNGLSSSYDDLTEAIDYNNEALDEQIKKQAELQAILQTAIQTELELKGKISSVDKERFKAEDDYAKRDQEISIAKMKHITELATKYKMTGEDFKQYSEKIAYFGELSKEQILAITTVLDDQKNGGLPRAVDERLSLMRGYYDKIQQYAIDSNRARLVNEEILNTGVDAINEKGVQSHKKKARVKQSTEEADLKKLLALYNKYYIDIITADLSMVEDGNQRKLEAENVRWIKEKEQFKAQKEELLILSKSEYEKVRNLAMEDLNLLNKSRIAALREHKRIEWEIMVSEAEKQGDAEAKIVESDLKDRLKDVKDNEQRLADVLKLENETNYTNEKITKKEHDQQDIKDQLAVLELKKENLDRYSHEYIEIEIKEQELKRQLREDEKAEMKKSTKEAIDNMQEIGEFVIKLNEERIKNNIEAIDHQQEMQKDAIDVQRKQAELGHANTLAFEEKKQADLEKERMKEQKKLVKLKELEMFMNAIAAFSKDDPKSAVAKALAELAIVKGVEATFAEDGGLLGQTKDKSWQGRKHKGGGDILVHAQTGEGILSRADISSMGGEKAFLNFKNMLGTNKLPQIPMSGVMFQGMDTRKLEDKLDNLEKAFKNKKEVYVDWESHGVMNVTTMENGIKDTVKHILKKPRI